jgi:hypothetical protein
MNLAAQIAAYRDKGFTGEQAEVITLDAGCRRRAFSRFPRLLFAVWRRNVVAFP